MSAGPYHVAKLYVALIALEVVTIAESTSISPWTVGLFAVLAPIGPVLVSYLLTRRKLQKQDTKVQEIHILVNSRLSKTLDALSEALVENIQLKDRLGMAVTTQERQAAAMPQSAGSEPEGG